MEVYVEYVFIDNMVINILLFLLTHKILKLDIKKTRIILVSLLGTAFAYLMPYLTFFPVIVLLVKIFIGVVLVSLLKKYTSIREFFAVLITFLSLTFMFGGAIYYLLDALNANYTQSGVLIYEYEIPVGLIILTLSTYSYLLFQLFSNFYKRKTVANYLFDVVIKQNKNQIKTKAFLDTGNRLVDLETKKPVVIINYKLFAQLFKNINPTDLLLGKLDKLPLKNSKYILAKSASGLSNKVLIFESEELQIFLEDKVNIIQNVMVGLSFTRFEDALEYSMLLNPLLLN